METTKQKIVKIRLISSRGITQNVDPVEKSKLKECEDFLQKNPTLLKKGITAEELKEIADLLKS